MWYGQLLDYNGLSFLNCTGCKLADSADQISTFLAIVGEVFERVM